MTNGLPVGLPLLCRRPIKKMIFFHYPRVSPGAAPLTKKPEDSGYEIGNGGGRRELFYISLRYFTAQTLCMMYIVHLRIINGFLEFTTNKNDYVRTLHKGMVHGFVLVFNSSAWCKARKFVTNLYPGFFPVSRRLEFGFLTVKWYGSAEN